MACPQKEVPELKAFLRDILPYVSGAFFTAAKELFTIIEKEVGDFKKARMVQDSFSPELLLSRRKADHAHVKFVSRLIHCKKVLIREFFRILNIYNNLM